MRTVAVFRWTTRLEEVEEKLPATAPVNDPTEGRRLVEGD